MSCSGNLRSGVIEWWTNNRRQWRQMWQPQATAASGNQEYKKLRNTRSSKKKIHKKVKRSALSVVIGSSGVVTSDTAGGDVQEKCLTFSIQQNRFSLLFFIFFPAKKKSKLFHICHFFLLQHCTAQITSQIKPKQHAR